MNYNLSLIIISNKITQEQNQSLVIRSGHNDKVNMKNLSKPNTPNSGNKYIVVKTQTTLIRAVGFNFNNLFSFKQNLILIFF